MKFGRKLVLVIAGTVLCCSTVILSSGKSRAAGKREIQGNFVNYNQKLLLGVGDKFHKKLEKTILYTFVFSKERNRNKKNYFPQHKYPVNYSIELLIRLLIIGGFGSVSIAGGHSLIQRYIQIFNQDSIIIISCGIVLLLLLVGSNIVIFLF